WLFEMSRRGLRVVVARDDGAPVDFAHPALVRPAAPLEARVETAVFRPQASRRAIAVDKDAAAAPAAERLRQARRALSRARAEAGDDPEKLEVVEASKRPAEAIIREA